MRYIAGEASEFAKFNDEYSTRSRSFSMCSRWVSLMYFHTKQRSCANEKLECRIGIADVAMSGFRGSPSLREGETQDPKGRSRPVPLVS